MNLYVASLWAEAPNSPALWIKIIIGLVIGLGFLFALSKAPAQMRNWIVAAFTFVSGGIVVFQYLWPKAINRGKADIPNNFVEGGAFFLEDTALKASDYIQVIAGFLIGLGIYSLLRIHLTRIVKRQKDAFFSGVLLVSMVAAAVIGLVDAQMKLGKDGPKLADPANWTFWQYGKDFIFEALIQQMDATMFSIIAFYILSAAYRAFRVRSVEATILLATALIVILSFLGLTSQLLNAPFQGGGFMANFKVTEIANWIRTAFQTPSLTAIDIGIGIGAVTMSLRIWLNLEKTGAN